MANPILLLMKGHPATGKSTLADVLARRLRWPLVDKDNIKDLTYQLPRGNVLAYDIMWEMARRQLRLGLSVIVDSPLSYPVAYANGQALAATMQARLWVVETRLEEAQWQARLNARLQQPPTHRVAGWENMQQLLADYAGCWQYAIAPEHHIVVDTALPTATLVQQIVERITLIPEANL